MGLEEDETVTGACEWPWQPWATKESTPTTPAARREPVGSRGPSIHIGSRPSGPRTLHSTLDTGEFNVLSLAVLTSYYSYSYCHIEKTV